MFRIPRFLFNNTNEYHLKIQYCCYALLFTFFIEVFSYRDINNVKTRMHQLQRIWLISCASFDVSGIAM